MAIPDYGIVGISFPCGCSDKGGTPKFCAKPEHRMHPCGCVNLGGNFIQCTKHYLRPIIIGILIVLLIGAVICTKV